MRVVIDGIEYVPRAEVPVPRDGPSVKAIQELTTALHLYRNSGCSGLKGCVWGALEAISPDFHALAVQSTEAAFTLAECMEPPEAP